MCLIFIDKFRIQKNEYEEIERFITSEESPVGIDAKKTHIFIIHKLAQIEERLETIEKQLLKQRQNMR